VASRTQVVCLCEGEQGKSIDPVFINALMKALKPSWLRRQGSNMVRLVPCGGRKDLIAKLPDELRHCLNAGADTTLMVWADCDDDCADCEVLKEKFRQETRQSGVSDDDFNQVVFICPKDRLENWIEYLTAGKTDESTEGPRVKHSRIVSEAAKTLGRLCKEGKPIDDLPPSLNWSCENWRVLNNRMKST
jgi:hypothetical protein